MPFSIAGPASPALPSLDGINRATDRISSGLRIDYQQNAAEAAITGRLDSAVGETTVEFRNALNQVSALQKADQTLGRNQELVERIQALSVQSGNGALSNDDQALIGEEIQGLLDQFADELQSANFNGNQLFGGAGIDIDALQMKLDSLRLNTNDVSSNPLQALQELQSEVTELRATIGSDLNAIDGSIERLSASSLTIEGSRSRLSDVDIAIEVANLIQEQINFEASVKVFNHQRLAEESILNLLG
ncbi:MAG: flagellin-like hook-associated protein FlgL [Candidatus Azotimanducaceae bacterium]|jgi:flagellin-like hook-associated protein FlgL